LDEPPGYTVLLLSSSQAFIDSLCFVAIGVLLLVLIGIAAFEAAFFSLSPEELSKFSKSNDSRDKTLMMLTNYPRQVQITKLTLSYAAKIGIITLAVFGVFPQGSWGVMVLTILVLIFFIVAGELIARALAGRSHLVIARSGAPVWRTLMLLTWPVTFPVLWLVSRIEKEYHRRDPVSAKEMDQMLDRALMDEKTAGDEREIVRGIVNFGAFTVKQLMRPRKDIAAIEITADFHELTDFINQCGFSRIPVYRDTIDNIEGVIYIKDLIPFIGQQSAFEWQKLLRPAFFVPEMGRISALLKDFQEKHVHMALVIDRYGRIAGLITLQDLIEEVIDDINEQFDQMHPNAD
jgi:putative hemolysin